MVILRYRIRGNRPKSQMFPLRRTPPTTLMATSIPLHKTSITLQPCQNGLSIKSSLIGTRGQPSIFPAYSMRAYSPFTFDLSLPVQPSSTSDSLDLWPSRSEREYSVVCYDILTPLRSPPESAPRKSWIRPRKVDLPTSPEGKTKEPFASIELAFEVKLKMISGSELIHQLDDDVRDTFFPAGHSRFETKHLILDFHSERLHSSCSIVFLLVFSSRS